jgi:cyclopropane fatty-acyl-phospholipid synthase-like methyltransferase
LWGAEFGVPEPLSLLSPATEYLNLQERQHLLFLGAGLGGNARLLARQAGMTVDAMDLRRDFADLGDMVSRKQGLDRTVPVQFLAPDQAHFRPAYYDAALVCEVLHLVPDVSTLLAEIAAAITPGGSVALMEFVRLASEDSQALGDFAQTEPEGGGLPCTEQHLRDRLEAAGLAVEHRTDISMLYVGAIRDGLGAVADRISAHGGGSSLTPGARSLVMAEVALWTNRIAALEGDALQMVIFNCRRPASGGAGEGQG